MLHLLKEYAEKHGLVVKPGFKPKDVRWAIACADDGKFLDIVELGDTTLKRNRGRSFKVCPDFSFSEMKAGGITKSHFLVETADVIALHSKNPEDPKLLAKHRYFWDSLNGAGKIMSSLKNVTDRLNNSESISEIRKRMEAERIRPTDKVTFKIGSDFPVESEAWHGWWQDLRRSLSPDIKPEKARKGKGNTTARMRSFLSGELIEPMRVQLKISNLSDVGGIASGDALISFKQDSFCSFGLVQAANAAVAENEAFVYREALNHLIRKTGIRLVKAKIVHWFKQRIPSNDDPLPWLEKGTGETDELNAQQQARELLESIQTGRRPDLHNNYYYALTLSGAAGRVMVRDWMEGQFEELVSNITMWFDDLEIVHRWGSHSAKPPKFLAVLGATVINLRELASPFVAKMWRVAVRAEPIPGNALALALNRARLDFIEDEPANHARMALMKAYHVRKDRLNGKEVTMKPNLNEEHPHPAYHCGRLMAVFAGLQRAALGDVGAGVVQRYYAAAGTTPALVLGRLASISQHHLSKIESRGLMRFFENKIASIWGSIKDYVPSTLTLEEQSLFALGYYQQMADMRTKKSEINSKEEENNE